MANPEEPMTLVINQLKRKAVSLIEAAEMLGVSPLTVRRALKSGRIRAMRFSPKGPYRIPLDAIDEFLSTESKKTDET
jgi:excisionase family DNA binding protein